MSIEKINQGDELSTSKDLVQGNIERLKELFPEILAEGKIDFKVLQGILGEEIEEGEEYFRFTWVGKEQSRREAHKPSTGTLRPCKEESEDWDKTQNLYIEGDNLEVLKLLQKSYAGKVKVIYIDPPYNTGKDFVYKDNYKDNLKNYQEITGQIDNEGNKVSTNSESEGRFHSNWLNLIYPRLNLARNLLQEDGVIIISIDDSEIENLTKITKEVFGENNYVATIVWQRTYAPISMKKYFSESHEYALVFAKNKNQFKLNLLPRTDKQNKDYKNPDNDRRGPWKGGNLTVGPPVEKQIYEIEGPTGNKFWPPKGYCWRFTKERFEELRKDNRIWFGANGTNSPLPKLFLSEVQDGVTPMTLWTYQEVGHNQESTRELRNLFGEAVFTNPKPTRYLKQILHLATASDKNSIILDFFSGSASIVDALFKLNSEDGGKRRNIQIQLPESTEKNSDAFKAGYTNIAEIGKERIRRAGQKILEENPLFKELLDVGFKVFKLDTSNVKAWDGNPENLEKSLWDTQDNIKVGRTEEDVLYEILLKYGLDLTLPIEERVIKGLKVFNVGYGALFVCLGNNITSKVAEGIGKWKEELDPEICRVIFKDAGFNDIEKTNSAQTLKRFGIHEIKSI